MERRGDHRSLEGEAVESEDILAKSGDGVVEGNG